MHDLLSSCWAWSLWAMSLLLGMVVFGVAWSILLPGYRWKTRNVPGYVGWPLLGNLLDIQASTWHGFHAAGAKRFGTVYKMWYGAEPHIVVTSAEHAKQVIAKCHHTFEFPTPMWGDDRDLILDGLPFAKNITFHKAIRNAWSPAFHPNSLAQYHELMLQRVDRLVAVLDQAAESGESVEMWGLLCKLSTSVVGSAAFGVDIGLGSEAPKPLAAATAAQLDLEALEPGAPQLGRRIQRSFEAILATTRPSKSGVWLPLILMAHPSFREPIRVLANMLPDEILRKLLAAQRELKEVALCLMRRERRREGADSSQKAKEPGLKPGSFLGHLLSFEDRNYGKLSDKEKVANVYSFLGAGAETPANAMSFTIYQLCLNPECEEKVAKEAAALLSGPSGGGLEDFSKLGESMVYANACFSEAMRTMPPASKLLREAVEDITLIGTDYHFPKGTKFEVSTLCAMKDASAFREPSRFVPERFIPGNPDWNLADERADMTFGGGVRKCIGWKFSHNLAKIALAKLYSRFRFELEPGMAPLKVATGLTMAPEHGLRLKVFRR